MPYLRRKLPPLYKYLDVEGAKLTLKNRNFKHAKPSTFNDTEDLTVGGIFPEELSVAPKIIEDGFTNVLLKNLNVQSTSPNLKTRRQVGQLQAIFKASPSIAGRLKDAKAKGLAKKVFNLEKMQRRSVEHVNAINQHMQDFRILCVSTTRDSERMWTRYAQNHQGVVLRIVPNAEKDSKYQLFRPVIYRQKRPPFYESGLDFLEGSLFGDQEARIKAALETIIYSKTLDWEYESEYRLAIPVSPGEDWSLMPYHPEELTELYLGANATMDFKAEIIELAKAVNSQIRIFQMSHTEEGKLIIEAV
jgi:hypothetical protein